MRFLFSGPGSAGHVFPMVPTAQALRAAGHQVLFAGSAPISMLRSTGMPAVEVGDGLTVGEAFRRLNPDSAYTSDGTPNEERMRQGARGFAELGRATVSDLLKLAADWQPDVLVHAAFQPGAPVAAAKLGIPSVVHNFGVMSTCPVRDMMAEALADEYRAHGLSGPAAPSMTLDVVPESLGGDGTGLRVRYLPFNGGGTVPAELTGRGERPRIVVTLGTVLTQFDGVRSIAELMRQAASVDAEFLLAVGDADLSDLGELPDNARPLPWVPLAELLDGADAIVHHGGSGTMLTAAVAGVPQLLLPQGADHFYNADAAEAQGFALRARAEEVDTALLERLLTDESLRKSAAAMQSEIASLPSPAELVAEFEAVAG